jgi:uncharacterized membrane protein HdeD (DUF308 family)
MWRWCAYLSGVVLIAVALSAVPSLAIVESYVGGSAVRGHVQAGRYFVNPEHGRPIVEVSESTWRAVYWLERLWPFSVLVPGLTGLFLTGYRRGPNGKPPPVPPAEPPPWVLWACLGCVGITVGGTLLCWFTTRTPWVTMLVGWILICLCGGTIAWLYSRALRQQSTSEPSAAPDRC